MSESTETGRKMNPEIKKLWVDTLRSGKYQQGKECLREGDTFCCLGVLTDIYIKHVGGEWEVNDCGGFFFHDEGAITPGAVMEWAGMSKSNPMVGDTDSVAELNDEGKSFAEIADAIEASL